jgi:hypothetical protein
MSEVDEYERVDTTSKQFEASAKFLLGLIEVGYIPDNNEIARRLNVPLGYVERCLEHQTVSQFARQHARMRKQHLDSQK